MPGTIVSIHLAPTAGAATHEVEQARAVEKRGLDGDRYHSGTGSYSSKPGPSREVTFIEAEAIEAVPREYELALTAAESRRNVVTRGVALNHLVDREFRVGSATFRGIRLCEPCGYLDTKTRPGIMKSLIHRGGLRAQVVKGGEFRVGDAVTPAEQS